MSERLTTDDIRSMTTAPWDEAKDAIRAGDLDWALDRVDVAVERWRSLQDYSINWITSLLTFIGDELGEEAVERSLRKTGEQYVRARREASADWASLPAAVRAKAIARAMVANFGECEVSEDDEKITLSFRCGSGGRLIDEGRYEGENGYLVLHEQAPRTFSRDELPVYCAHCAVNNEIQPVEWTGYPITVESPPTGELGLCVHHIYRDMSSVPDDVYVRIGKEKPSS